MGVLRQDRSEEPGSNPEFSAQSIRPIDTVKAVIGEAHRGEIRVESTPGRGSTFTLELPSSET